MQRTITLQRLHFSMRVNFRNKVDRIQELLPSDLATRLNENNSAQQAHYVFNATVEDGTIHAKAAYERCADYITKLGNDTKANDAIEAIENIEAIRNLGEIFDEKDKAHLREKFATARLRNLIQDIAQKWNVQDLINKRDNLRNIIEGDYDINELSAELIRWLEAVIALRNEDLLKQVLAVLTILSVTRCVDDQNQHRWKEISKKLADCLTITTNFPENPLEKYRNHLTRDNENWTEAQKTLEVLLNATTTSNQRVDIFAEMGNFFLSDRFNKGNNVFSQPTQCQRHIEWLYGKKFLPENKEVNDMLDVNNKKRDFSTIKLLRLAALDCFRKAQQYLENANNPDSIAKWREVSESYLKHVRELYKNGSAYLTHFKQSVQASTRAEHKKWYGESFLEIAKDCLEKKDSANFIEYLKLARKLNDSDDVKFLTLRTLSPLAEDTYKEFFDGLKESLQTDWKVEKLINELKASKNNRIRGEVYWRLYLKEKNPSYLRTSFKCGFPQAIKAWDNDTVSYCEKLQHAAADEEISCFLNVDAENSIAKIFKATCPKATKFYRLTDIEDFKSGNSIVLLITDNAEKNLADFLYVLEEMKKAEPSLTITIFVKTAEDKPTQVIIDTALQQFFNVDKEKRPRLRVEIIDELRDAARFLLARHPIFFPIRNKNLTDAVNLRFVVIGDGELAKNLVREASHLMTFHKDLKITPKITLLTPFGHSLKTELRAVNPALAQQIDEPDDVLLPGFAVPPSKKGITLAEKINELIGDGDALYFAVALSQYNLNNLNIAITVRETVLCHQIRNDQLSKEIPVAFYCPDPDISFLSARSIVLGEEYKNSPTQFNTYALIPFGSRLRFTYRNLMSNIFSRLSLTIHLNYCGVTGNTESLSEDYYASYAKKTYNRQSSLAVAMSIPYRLFNYSQLFKTNVFDNDWEITDENAIFSESKLKALAEKININKKDNQTEKLYQLEHARWISYMTLGEGWIPVTLEEVERYINAGNSRQQCFASNQHPCLTEWRNLKNLSEEISKLLGKNKDFQKSDITSILSTSEIMKETVIRKSESLKKMFCLPN